MASSREPLVSVLTPVYNGEAYLAECIESVLAQTYSNWEYIIVNNCSTDGTSKIAEEYARKDKRIRVCQNDVLLDVIANHNRAFRLISPDSKYCKVVSADDWIFPECITRMVEVAEANPSVGIVGSYQLSGGGTNWWTWRVQWDEIPYPSTVIPGHEVCRTYFLGGPYVFGDPTSLLYRSDLIRGQESFYPNATPEADTSACCMYLQNTDFGYVHQVLSRERVHEVRITTTAKDRNAYLSSKVGDLLAYGPFYLTEEELRARRRELLDVYYRFLAVAAIHSRGRDFWSYHKKRLSELGYPLDRIRLGRAICAKLLDLLLNPKQTAEKALRRLGASS